MQPRTIEQVDGERLIRHLLLAFDPYGEREFDEDMRRAEEALARDEAAAPDEFDLAEEALRRDEDADR